MTTPPLRLAIRYADLPLAVYREIAAHLQCLEGVEATLEDQDATEFRYADSQVAALVISQALTEPEADGTTALAPRVRAILDHYGLWQSSSVL